MTETDRQRRTRWFLRALRHKGVLTFPPVGWPGWDEARREQARRDLDETLRDVSDQVSLHIEKREDGTVVVRELAALN